MDKIEANRNFANKLWNCCKFVTDNALKQVEDDEIANIVVDAPISEEEYKNLPLPERYIISKCHTLVESVTEDIEKYQLGAAGSKVSKVRQCCHFSVYEFSVQYQYNKCVLHFGPNQLHFRFTNSYGINMLIGILKFLRHVCMKVLVGVI